MKSRQFDFTKSANFSCECLAISPLANIERKILRWIVCVQKLFKFCFSARRYSSAVYSVVVCLSVRLSQTGIVSKPPYGPRWLWHGSRVPVFSFFVILRYYANPFSPTVYYNEIRVSTELRILLYGTLSRTLDLDNFAVASRSCSQQNSSTVELVDHTYDGRLVVARHALVYLSVDRNARTPLLRFVVDLLYNLLCSSWHRLEQSVSASRTSCCVMFYVFCISVQICT